MDLVRGYVLDHPMLSKNNVKLSTDVPSIWTVLIEKKVKGPTSSDAQKEFIQAQEKFMKPTNKNNEWDTAGFHSWAKAHKYNKACCDFFIKPRLS